jgi:hypothetical protein
MDFKENVNNLTKDIMYDLISNRFIKYDNLCKTFESFFDREELGCLIDRKADIELFNRL